MNRTRLRLGCSPRMLGAILLVLGGTSFAAGTGEVQRLVPATVSENPELPSLEILVRGESAQIHYRAFGFTPGEPVDGPVLFMMHGSLSDMRGYLPLIADIAEDLPVFLWDMRGNGLSERVPAAQLGFEWMSEEIEAVRQLVVPDSPIILLGYSWSGVFAAMYAGQHPQQLAGLILIEPPGLTGDYQNQAGGELNLFGPGYLGMTYLSEVISPRDHDSVDFRSLAMLESGVRDFFVDPLNRPQMPVWRVGGLALAVWEASVIGRGGFVYDYTAGLDEVPVPALFLGSTHSPIGYEFQASTNMQEFRRPEIVLIPDAGHRMIVEHPEAVTAAIRDYNQRALGESSATEERGER